MDKIDVKKIEQSNLSGIEKIAELQVQSTMKVNELVERYNEVMVKIVKINGRIDNIMLKL